MYHALTFAGVPFLEDDPQVFRAKPTPRPEAAAEDAAPLRKQQPACGFLDEIDRLIPLCYARDFSYPPNVPARTLSSLARRHDDPPEWKVRVGEWYYPSGASRWSVFRGLMSSAQVNAVLAAVTPVYSLSTAGASSSFASAPGRGLFVVSCSPNSAPPANYTVSTPMYLLPPRPLAEHGGGYDGLYLVTLVDERYYLSTSPCTLAVSRDSTWLDLVGTLATQLGITVNALVPPAYLQTIVVATVQSFMDQAAALLGAAVDPTGAIAADLVGLILVSPYLTLAGLRTLVFNFVSNVQVTTGLVLPSSWGQSLTNALAEIVLSVPPSYGVPEPDSQLWASHESGAVLLDAVAANIGRTVVREYDGTYSLLTPAESFARANLSRGPVATLVKSAGGDAFAENLLSRAGSLMRSRNTVAPRTVRVAFPQYVVGDDPVPHFVNKRYGPGRPSAWFEDSHGGAAYVDVPITSGGPFTSGAVGLGGTVLHTTAKALYASERDMMVWSGAFSGAVADPLNASGLVSLGVRLARDTYERQLAGSLDEVYPGIYPWRPEGLHDIVWTYSDRRRQASTRVVRDTWTQLVDEFQHGTFPVSGGNFCPRGVGGKSVAQSWVDYNLRSGTISTTLAANLATSGLIAFVNGVPQFPSDTRWKGTVGDETILFEQTAIGGYVTPGTAGTLTATQNPPDYSLSTTGGTTPTATTAYATLSRDTDTALSGVYALQAVYRGVDGTVPAAHLTGTTLFLAPADTHGVNAVGVQRGQFIAPNTWSSGGVQEVFQIPQTQTVRCVTGSGAVHSGLTYYSGQISYYDPVRSVRSGGWENVWPVWLLPRVSGAFLDSGGRFDGQFVGYSPSVNGVPSPVYAVGEDGGGGGTLIVRAPGHGIPALSDGFNGEVSGMRVGKANCAVYKTFDRSGRTYLETAGMSVSVKNLNPIAVASGRFVTAVKDRYGAWLVPSQGLRFAVCSGTVTTAASDCCGGGCDGAPSPLAVTFTDKTGCYANLPDSTTLACTYDEFLDYRSWTLETAISYCTSNGSLSIGCDGDDAPTLNIQKGNGDNLTVDAESATCTTDEFAAVFRVDDGAGNTVTVTVVY